METDSKRLGELGEKIALNHLKEKGYEVISKNWRYKHKEVDIIMKDNDEIVFVEVKTRKYEDFETPRDLIKRKKQRFLIEAADAYLRNNEVDNVARFDVIIIFFEKDKPIINHIEEAFHPHMS